MVIEGTLEKVPYFNAPIYLENKTQIGKVEEIMGPIHKYMFSVKTQEGVKAESFTKGDKVPAPVTPPRLSLHTARQLSTPPLPHGLTVSSVCAIRALS
jgi:rRNA processing protein Gar1